jgi:hypothetical protein
MKNKVKHHSSVSKTSSLFSIQPGKTYQANEPGFMNIKRKWETTNQAHPEDFIPDEFGIDTETMEEHLPELLKYMMHNQLIDKIPHN